MSEALAAKIDELFPKQRTVSVTEIGVFKRCRLMWLDVVGYEAYYEVSSLGEIRSKRSGVILSPNHAKSGERRVNLVVRGVTKQLGVHTIVAAAHIGPCPSGFEINHKDENRSNNAADNLEYLTHLDNIQYSAILTPSEVQEIRQAYNGPRKHPYQSELATQYGVTQTAISAVLRGKTWSNI